MNTGYSLAGYGEMGADKVRVEAYAAALRATVRPGSVVADLGAGTGIFSVLACQLGARKVFAIEPDPVIQVACEVAAANGCADKIEFIEKLSTAVDLPELCDVVVADLRGVLPLWGQHLPSIADARRRFLSPGGTLIPQRDTLWMALADAPELYGQFVDNWDRNTLGLDLRAPRAMALNRFQKARLREDQLLTVPQLWISLDYTRVDSPDARAKVEMCATRTGVAHGFIVWFDAELTDGVGFSNAPSEPNAIYGSLYFPWTNPTPLALGQMVTVDLQAKMVDDDYIWRWISSTVSGQTQIAYDQSQLLGVPLSLKRLTRSAADFVPRLTSEGCAHRRTLELMNGSTSLDHIARQLALEFPQQFGTWQKALAYVAATSRDHGE